MKAVMILGLVLIAAGLLVFSYGFTYTTSETVADVGPLKITVDKEHRLPSPNIVGGLALGAGIVLFLVGTKDAWV